MSRPATWEFRVALKFKSGTSIDELASQEKATPVSIERAIRHVLNWQDAERGRKEPYGEVCEWRFDESDCAWESACGEYWQFIDGGPEENRVEYCHGCGKPVKEVKE